MKKKVDPRIRQLLENAVQNNHRALLVLVGDKGRDQVVNLHYMLAKMTVAARPSVLWCYKKELGFSSNKKKRMKIIKKRVKQGLVDPNKDDPFELFISSTTIRFAYYSESQNILGNTYGMCVLQDFEALTPNLLARTFETVQGGGLNILLIKNMSSLKQLYGLTMDVHARLRTEAHNKVVGRFNERFILSLADCPAAIVADDELNVLPITSHVRAMPGAGGNLSQAPMETGAVRGAGTDASPELQELKASLADTPPIGALVAKTKTIDQAKALLRFEEAISEKTLRSTVALTASRGRGKSAALGLAVAAAVSHDYSNIFVTSPSPENLRTFFAFLFVGFDALEYQEHTDYEIIQSTDPAMNKAIIRVNIFRNHRQTVQYLNPTDASSSLAQAELLVIDEAAAIPLPVVQSMLGPYLVFLCSTVTGYEGTGRSLSLKLINQLRTGSVGEGGGGASSTGFANRRGDRNASAAASRSGAGRVFREVHMETPIRYGDKDPVEAWLYDLLCLEAGGVRQTLTSGAPHPDQCELYYVERDALFSRHRASEAFLHRIMALFVSSHYKNSPNDLQMLSDAPAHALFVLLAPTRADTEKLPDVLCAIQVCLEGRISSQSAKSSLARGHRASGDLIPWTLSQQYQESDFATLAGLRIVRVATHPDVQKMGYGSRALKMLLEYYAGKHQVSLDEDEGGEPDANRDAGDDTSDSGDEEDGVENGGQSSKKNLLNELIGPRKSIPPLLRRLHERRAEVLDYMGVSYGLTQGLFNFWSRLGFVPLYLRLTPNELTGEHTCIMVTTSVSERGAGDGGWLSQFHLDFRRRFVHLLGYDFRKLAPGLALAVLQPSKDFHESSEEGQRMRKSIEQIKDLFSPYDRRRLESYARSLIDYHVIVDMLPKIAELYTLGGFGSADEFRLSPAQSAILMALGLQHKSVDDLERSLGLQASQVLALFNKVVRKVSNFLRTMEENAVAAGIGPADASAAASSALPKASLKQTLEEDLEDGAKRVAARDAAVIDAEKNGNTDAAEEGLNEAKGSEKKKKHDVMQQYKIAGNDEEWEAALPSEKSNGNSGPQAPNLVSIKTVKRKAEKETAANGSSAKGSGIKKKRRRSKGAM